MLVINVMKWNKVRLQVRETGLFYVVSGSASLKRWHLNRKLKRQALCIFEESASKREKQVHRLFGGKTLGTFKEQQVNYKLLWQVRWKTVRLLTKQRRCEMEVVKSSWITDVSEGQANKMRLLLQWGLEPVVCFPMYQAWYLDVAHSLFYCF